MAEQQQRGDFSFLYTGSDTGTAAPQAPLSKVDEFKKANIDDGTKVGGVEAAILPKVASGIESARKSKLGFIVNPALNTMENIYKRIIQPAQSYVSTAALLPEAAKKYESQGLNGLVKSFKYAVEKSKEISMGQAIATNVGQSLASVTPDAVSPTFMKEGFDVFDASQRSQAFRDEFVGIITSGATDLAVNGMASKGTGIVTREVAKKVRGASRIVTEKDMASFSAKADEAVAWGQSGKTTPAPSGLAIYMDDAVRETNVQRLFANPLVAETSNPSRTATILSRLDNHLDVADYLKAERGDAAAFDRFFQRQALTADHLDNYGFKDFGPVSDWAKIHDEVLSENLAPRYQAIINDLKTKDAAFAKQLDDFASKKVIGVTEDYMPGRFGVIESAALQASKMKQGAKFGDLKLFGTAKPGQEWKTTVYQSRPYDRVVRVIAYAGSGRPQGYINISNPRKGEAANDLLSDLNRLNFLRGREGAKFKRAMVEKFSNATNNTEAARAIAEIEREVMLKLAKEYNVRSIGDLETDKDVIATIEKWHNETSSRRSTAQEYARKQGLIPDEGGTLNVVQLRSQTTEVNNMPMLDFRRLEMEVIKQTYARANVRSGITKGTLARTYAGESIMHLSQLLDVANMVFNNLNLLRVAYIPKNAMVDPFMRGSMAMESAELVTNAIPGIRNTIYNGSNMARLVQRYVPGTASYASRKAEQVILKEIDMHHSTLNPLITKMEAANKAEIKAEAAWQAARKSLDEAEKALKTAKPQFKPSATEAKHLAEHNFYQAQIAFSKATADARLAKDAVQGISTVIEKNRARVADSIRRPGDLLQKKHLGEGADVIRVDGKDYSIKGLADPNARGASVYIGELDSASNLYSKLFESEASMNIRAQGSLFVKIKRQDTKAYFNAIAHIANRQIRQELDMPLGMMLRGESDQTIMNFLYKTEAGREYRKRMSAMAGKDLTSDDLLAWVSETSAYMQKMIPSQELRNIILERPITVKETEKFLKNRPDLLEEIDGPNVSMADLSKGERLMSRVSNAQATAWRLLGATENRLVRNPMFISYTREEMRTLIASARRSGIDPSDAVVNHQFRQIAYRRALDRVESTLYSSRRLTNGMYALRYAMAFPLAFFNSQAVALKLMAKNPMNAYWYSEVSNALSNFAPYQDEEGNTYKSMADVPEGTPVSVTWAVPDKFTGALENLPVVGKLAKEALAPYTDKRGGGLKWNPKQMEFMIADPSIAWFGSVAVSSLIKEQFNSPLWKGPQGEEVVKFLRSTFGDQFYENSILYGGYVTSGRNVLETAFNAIKPGYLESLFPTGQRFADQVYTNWRVSYGEWVRNGRIGEPPTMQQAEKSARNLNFIRAIVQFNAPISTSFDPVTRAAKTYYADLVDSLGGDYQKADAKFIEEWGLDAIALLGSNQKNLGGLSSTMNDMRMIRKNTPLLEKIARIDPKYAQIMSSGYGDIATDYSPEIAEMFKNLNFPGTLTKISEQKSDQDVAREVEARMGWAEYNKAADWRDAKMYEYGVTSTYQAGYTTYGIKAQFNAMTADIKKKYPGWVQDRKFAADEFWDKTVPALTAIAEDPTWRKYTDKVDGGKWAEISYWLGQVNKFKQMYGSYGTTTARDEALKSSLANFHYQFVQQASDGFSVFASRWLESMPELDVEKVAQ